MTIERTLLLLLHERKFPLEKKKSWKASAPSFFSRSSQSKSQQHWPKPGTVNSLQPTVLILSSHLHTTPFLRTAAITHLLSGSQL